MSRYSRLMLGLTIAVGLAASAWLVAAPATSVRGDGPVEVTFTKWITVFPDMAGTIGGEVSGSYHGKITNQPNLTLPVSTIEALYTFNTGGAHSFTARLTITQDNVAGTAVLTGTVTEGWNKGARVSGEYRVITPCVQAAPMNRCFQGKLRIGS